MSQKYPTVSTVTADGTKVERKERDHTKSGKLRAKLNRKRNEAIERQVVYEALNVADKINRATLRRGNSAKELKRLMKAVGITNVTVTPAPVVTEKKKSKKVKKTEPMRVALP